MKRLALILSLIILCGSTADPTLLAQPAGTQTNPPREARSQPSADHTAPFRAGQPPIGKAARPATAPTALTTKAMPHQAKEKAFGEQFLISRLELKETKVVDALRLISEMSGINAVATQDAGRKTVTLYLQEVTAKEAVETLSKISGLWYRQDKDTQTFRVMTTDEYQKDVIVFREDLTETFKLLYPNATSVAMSIRNLYGTRVMLSFAFSDDDLFGGGMMGGGGMMMGGVGGGGAGGSGMGGFSGGMMGGMGGMGGGMMGGMGGMMGGMGGMGGGMGAQGQKPLDSQRLVDEAFSPAQLAELERRFKDLKSDGEKLVPGEALIGISRKDPPIYLTIVRQHNLLVVRTSDSQVLDDIRHLVSQLDQPTRQVLLEMKILELTVGDSFRSIFDIATAGGRPTTGPPDGQPPNPLDLGASTGLTTILGLGNFPVAGGTLVYQYLSDQLRARVELLQQNNRVDVVATPVIMASNLRPATLFVGEQRVMVTGATTNVVTPGTGATTTVVNPLTTLRNIGTTLFIIPTVNLDRTVTLRFLQDNSSLLKNSASIPLSSTTGAVTQFPIDTVNTATLSGTVVAKDKLTIAVGGLIKKSVSSDVKKIPILGDIPILGKLFRHEQDDKNKSELVLLITPHVLDMPEEAETVSNDRIPNLSRHPYHQEKDRALESHFEKLMTPPVGGVEPLIPPAY